MLFNRFKHIDVVFSYQREFLYQRESYRVLILVEHMPITSMLADPLIKGLPIVSRTRHLHGDC